MSRPKLPRRDVSSSDEVLPPKFPEELNPLKRLNDLHNYRFGGKDIYEDVLKALSEGRDYKDWAWWPYLIFPVPEEPYKYRHRTDKKKVKIAYEKSLDRMVELLTDERWGLRLGYAVKVLDNLGSSGITKIIEAVPGKEAQNIRRFWLWRFLLSFHAIMAVPNLERDEDAKQLCFRVVTGSWVGDTSKFAQVQDPWGFREDSDGKLQPLDFGNLKPWQPRRGRQGRTSYFGEGVKLAAARLALTTESPEVKVVISEDGLRERLGGKGNQLPSTLNDGIRARGPDDVPGKWQGVRVNSYLRQHQGQPTSTRDNREEPNPFSSMWKGTRQPAPAHEDYDSDAYEYVEDYPAYEYDVDYLEDYIPERDRGSSSRQHYAHSTSTRDYGGAPSSSASTRRQPAPAPYEYDRDPMPEHVRRVVREHRKDSGYPDDGNFYISGRSR